MNDFRGHTSSGLAGYTKLINRNYLSEFSANFVMPNEEEADVA